MLRDLSENIEPRHVISIASVYSQLAQQVDHKNNVLTKINSLQMKSDGMTDDGVDAMAKLSLAQSSRTLKTQRDMMAEVAGSLHIEELKDFPDQSTLDMWSPY